MRKRCSWQLAAAASGSMRDALTCRSGDLLLSGEISHSGVIDMLGVPEQAQVFELLSAMAKGNLPCSFAVETISDHTPDYSNTLIRCYQRCIG